MLSHIIETRSKVSPKSTKGCFIYKIWAQQLPITIYFVSIVDRATDFYFLLAQDISDDPRKWHVPLVIFLTLHTIKLAFK